MVQCAGPVGAFTLYILSFPKHPIKQGLLSRFQMRVLKNLPGWWGGAWVQILTVLQKTFFRAKWKLWALTKPGFLLGEERMMPLREI